jgi:hypothetical protein
MEITKPSGEICTYPKNESSNMWTLPLSAQSNKVALSPPPGFQMLPTQVPYIHQNNAAVNHQLNAEFVKYVHASFGNPSLSTFITAARRGYFGNLPRLTVDMINDNPPVTTATASGHLDQTRQVIRPSQPSGSSIQAPMTVVQATNITNIRPLPDIHIANHTIYSKDYDLKAEMHSDLAGKFPFVSYRGNQYILVSVFHGYIHVEVMPNRESNSYLKAFRDTYTFFASKGHTIKLQTMDKETSGAVSSFFTNEAKVQLNYVPTSIHRRNKAERAIRTFKNHFISTLATANPAFPLSYWEAFIPQAEITINLLRCFRLNPAISAYHGIYGKTYDFLSHPIAPCGTKVVVLEPSDKRNSWSSHGVVGFYLGPELDVFRSYLVYIPTTNKIRSADSVSWFPTTFEMPGSSKLDIINTNLESLVKSLTHLGSSHLPPTNIQPYNDLVHNSVTNLFEAVSMLHPPSTSTSNSDSSPTSITNPLQRVITSNNEPITPTEDVQRVLSSSNLPQQDNSNLLNALARKPRKKVSKGQPIPQTAALNPTSSVNIDITPSVPTPPQSIVSSVISTLPVTPSSHNSKKTKTSKSKTSKKKKSEPEPSKPIEPTDIPPNLIPSKPFKRKTSKPTRYADHITRQINHYANTAANLDLEGNPLTHRKALAGPDKEHWIQSDIEEIERLLETGTAIFIDPLTKPAYRAASYYNPQVKIKIKDGVRQYRTRGTIGGDRIDYDGEVHAWTANLTTIKLLLNATVSENAHFMTADIKDFYLNTELPRKEYMRVHRKQVPDFIIQKYNLEELFQNHYIMMEISKGIYGLPQAGKLAQDRLIAHLNKHGYHLVPSTPCLFRHETRDIAFTLVVDDFGIKFSHSEDATHLLDTLRELYTITVDESGSKYVGLTIKHDRQAKTLTISMPNYIKQALVRFGIDTPKTMTDSPVIYTPPEYGQKKQQKPKIDTSPKLTEVGIKRLQVIIGVLLYYARAVDPTLLVAVNKIASRITTATEDTNNATTRLLQYVACHPEASITYHASKMILCVHSDASYLSETQARSRAGSLMYLSNDSDPIKTLVNGAIEYSSTIIGQVVASAFEAEYAALFLCGQSAEAIRTTLAELGYPQQPTVIICDNTSAVGIVNHTNQQCKSKAIDMRYHWIRDRSDQGHFKVLWYPAKYNLADYFTKAHPVYHVKALRKYFVEDKQINLSEGVLIDKQPRRLKALTN